MDRERPLPAGRPPWDPINGFRVGFLAGGVVGGLIGIAAGALWLAFVGAAVGGVAGFGLERRKQRTSPPRPR